MSTTKEQPRPKRQPLQLYVPRHRRKQAAEQDNGTSTAVSSNKGALKEPSIQAAESTTNNTSPTVNDAPEATLDNLVEKTKTLSISHNESTTEQVPAKDPSAIKDDPVDASSPGSVSSREDWEDLLDELDEPAAAPAKAPEKKTKPVVREPTFSDEPTTILDCFDFPPTFQTHHLHDIFRGYEDMRGGYQIKWMHDTRALIIFNSAAVAKRAYLDNLSNTMATIQPYTGPTDFLNAGKHERIPQRPATSDIVARRLVHGALGVRSPRRTPEQRKAEQDILNAERERQAAKRNEALQRARASANAFYD